LTRVTIRGDDDEHQQARAEHERETQPEHARSRRPAPSVPSTSRRHAIGDDGDRLQIENGFRPWSNPRAALSRIRSNRRGEPEQGNRRE